MTPNSAYFPGTPGGQPMTPGGGMDVMSPVVGLFPIVIFLSITVFFLL